MHDTGGSPARPHACLAGLCLLLCSMAMADSPVGLTVTLEPPVIPFYRQARLTVAVDGPSGMEAAFPAGGVSGGTLPVTPATEREYTKLPDGRMRISRSWMLDALEPGEYALEPVRVEVDGEIVEAPAPVLVVREATRAEVAALLRFAPNDAPPGPGFSLLRAWWFWLVLVLLAAAAFWMRRKRPPTPEFNPLPATVPWEKALARLDALERRGWPRTGRFEAYFVALSGILRDYLSERYGIQVTEQTTPEFLTVAREFGLFAQEQQEHLARLLRLADRVKFARYEPSIRQMEDSLTLSRRFVNETTPPPESAPDAAEAEGAA